MMSAHAWLFPWFAFVVGLLTLAVAFWGGHLRLHRETGPPPSFLVLWFLVSGGAVFAGLRVGAAAGADFAPARGLLLGCIAGLVLAWLVRGLSMASDRSRATTFAAPLLFGYATALVAGARLWLTHGEISGLTALSLGFAGAAVAAGAFARDLTPPAERGDDAADGGALALQAILYLASLAAAADLGFTRAGKLEAMFWADVPLLLAAGLCVAALLSAGTARLNPSLPALPALPSFTVAVLAAGLVSWRVARSPRPLELVLLGMAAMALLLALQSRRRVSDGRAEQQFVPAEATGESLNGPLTALMMVVAAVLGFALWSGYGVALTVIGAWYLFPGLSGSMEFSGEPGSYDTHPSERGGSTDASPSQSHPSSFTRHPSPGSPALAFLAFGAILLLHRLLILQAGSGIRLSGPGDTWDLFGIAVGATVPLALGAWTAAPDRAAVATALEWLVGVGAAAILVGLLWGPRFSAGVLVGAALSPLFAGAGSVRRLLPAIALSAVLFALLLLEFLPQFQNAGTFSHTIRVAAVLVGGAIAALRITVGGRRQ